VLIQQVTAAGFVRCRAEKEHLVFTKPDKRGY
jgi:hypothetical protein